jgi:hypothetical protein
MNIKNRAKRTQTQKIAGKNSSPKKLKKNPEKRKEKS